MKLTFFGAAREVTGSRHLLEVNNVKILLDCGLFQGNRKQSYLKNQALFTDFASIDYVILSHAHMDHSGGLPFLVKNGFRGKIISTPATQDLCSYMLLDSAYIQAREVEFMKKHNVDTVIEPLYTEEDVVETLSYFQTLDFNTELSLKNGIKLTFKQAGHILGAGMVVLKLTEPGQNEKTLTFTGDLGRKESTLLNNPDIIDQTDFLIMETTYGNRFHKWIKDVDVHLADLINETVAKGGKIIIPAFALERTQEIVYYINVLQKEGKIPGIPVFVDSPLAINVTQVFKQHLQCYKKSVREEFLQHHKTPFDFDTLKFIHTADESKSLNSKNGPMIIISASGMCEFGRILHHLKNNIENPRNTILIAGYQAEHTLGRKLVDKEKMVKIFGEIKRVKAKVVVLDAFSGHADRSDLIDFVSHIQDVKKIFLVHGEESQGLTFSEILNEIKPDSEVFVPMPKEQFIL